MSATAKAMVYFELRCDRCGDDYQDEEGTIFSEASEVREMASNAEDWRQQPDGRDLCSVCAWSGDAPAEREVADQ